MNKKERYELKEYEHGLFIQDNKNNKIQYYSQSKASMNKVIDRLNEQEEKNMQLRNQIKIFELFLDCNDLDIEWDSFCIKEDGCPFTDTSCQECIYLGISNGDVDD